MRAPRTADYLDHILQAAAQISEYVGNAPKDEFVADKRTHHAVVMNLMVIGEAATQLLKEAPSFADQHPEIAWRDIRAMRNRLAHGYFDINLDIVWNTVQTALPELAKQIAAIQRQERFGR